MKLLKGRFRSRKSMKRATRRQYITSQGRTYITDKFGNRYTTLPQGPLKIPKKYVLSAGPLR